MPSLLNASDLCGRLPHAERMCLLDCVVAWDEDGIHCTALSHRSPDNPLRTADGLPAVSGVEYAAQAMAVHGGLCTGHGLPRMGALAAVRNLELHTEWLHEHRGELEIFAQKLQGDNDGGVYDFRLATKDGVLLLSGRATVIYKTGIKTS